MYSYHDQLYLVHISHITKYGIPCLYNTQDGCMCICDGLCPVICIIVKLVG